MNECTYLQDSFVSPSKMLTIEGYISMYNSQINVGHKGWSIDNLAEL